MKLTPLSLKGLFLIEPCVFEDERGFFYESFNQQLFNKTTELSLNFVQDNNSRSVQHVLRGLHYQVTPMAQGKLVRVIDGEIFDVVVDIRPTSPTFGKHLTMILSGHNRKQLFIPEGFAHGFLTLSAEAEILYKVSEFYSPAHDRSLLWSDPKLGIDWPLTAPAILSEKDANANGFI